VYEFTKCRTLPNVLDHNIIVPGVSLRFYAGSKIYAQLHRTFNIVLTQSAALELNDSWLAPRLVKTLGYSRFTPVHPEKDNLARLLLS
jgi:hypothetical protein